MNSNQTLADLQKGNTIDLPHQPAPAQTEWWNINSSINLSTFGYAANFDSGVSFVLPFYIDRNVRKILEVGLTLTFQKFRVDATPQPHTHDVTIPNHTHDVTIPNHTHDVTISNHTHDVTLSDHTHSVPGSSHTHGLSIPVANRVSGNALTYSAASPELGCSGGGTIINGSTATATTPGSVTSGSGGGTTVTSASGGGATITSASGGGTTVTSAAGGGTTVTSSAVSASTLGIAESSFPTDVHVLVDGVDITANLGGVFNPNISSYVFKDLELTPFVKEPGLHTLEFTTSGLGRCLPLLWIKSIISK